MPSVEFVHGRIKASALRSVLADAKQIVVISAYTTPKGLAEIQKPIIDCIKHGGTVTILLGLDRGGVTSAALVRALAAIKKKAGERLQILLVIEKARAFLHAKVFAARKAKGAEVLIGSFNLTGSGLTTNHELAARLSGSTAGFFQELAEFIESIPDKRELTLENAEAVANALTSTLTASESAEVAEERRRAAQQRLQKLNAALANAPGKEVDLDQAARWLGQLLAAGGFWSYEFDLEKLSVPSGLATFYDRGLLLREKVGEAGTANMRLPAAVSASFPLVPSARQRQYGSLAKRLGKAFRACGFETPFGWWVPEVYVERLRTTARDIERVLRSNTNVENEVRAFIDEHKSKIEKTTDEIIRYATESGIEHPSRWKDVRDPSLAEIKGRYSSASPPEWTGSTGYSETLAYIRATLLRVKEKLDPDLAIAKLERIRPELLAVPVDCDDKVVRRLLECMTWAVVEDRGVKNTKPAVRDLSQRRQTSAKGSVVLTDLSQALLEGVDGAEATFFRVFGAPPFWQPTAGATDLDLDDED